MISLNKDKTVIEIITHKNDPTGLKTVGIRGKTIKTFVIPRVDLAEIDSFEYIDKPGIYFLLNDDLNDTEVYIGQTDNILRRIREQKQSKENWTTALAFTAGNEMNASFLEKICLEEVKKAGRYKANNKSAAPGNKITESNQIVNLQFMDDIKFITKLLGYAIFSGGNTTKKTNKFYLVSKGIKAIGSILENNEFIVYKNSEAALKNVPSLEKYVKSSFMLRQKLIEEKILVNDEKNRKLIFSNYYIFRSPSGASDVITGMATNGWISWKGENGKTLDENIRKP